MRRRNVTATLIFCGIMHQVPLDPVPVCEIDPEPLLLRAAEEPGTGRDVKDTPENRRKGWWRVCLFATYVVPSKQKSERLSVCDDAAVYLLQLANNSASPLLFVLSWWWWWRI